MVLLFNVKNRKCTMRKRSSAVFMILDGSTKELHTHLYAKHHTKAQKVLNMAILPSTSHDC